METGKGKGNGNGKGKDNLRFTVYGLKTAAIYVYMRFAQLRPLRPSLSKSTPRKPTGSPFELNKPDCLLWGALRASSARSPAGWLLQLVRGLGGDPAVKCAMRGFRSRLLFVSRLLQIKPVESQKPTSLWVSSIPTFTTLVCNEYSNIREADIGNHY
jgi:hypothetical protein